MAAGAATAAAAASQAAAAVLSTTEQFRRTDLLRTLVQKPDVYKPTTRDQEIESWSDWKHGLKNYLSVVDAKYVEEMEVIESDPSRPSSISTMADDTKRRARELYSILVSFMRGRPAKLARAITDQNGYEVWRTLTMEMQPSSRQRQLALVAQLSTVRFDPAKSLSEQVTRYEEIIAEYERISSSKFSEDLKITTLVQAAPAALQVQLHMSLNSETTYAKLREQLLAYERSTTRWQASSTLTLPTTSTTSQDTGGPMDVDRVERDTKGKKGKDRKGKGDPKGKGGKKGGKNDATAKPKAKPKGECWYCGKTGHFARDCRAKAKEGKGKGGGKVQQVTQEETPTPPPSSSSLPPSSASTFSTSTAATQQQPRAVRRVRMVTPPGVPSCVVYDISEDTAPAEDQDLDEDEYYSVRAVRFESGRGTAQGSHDPSDEEIAAQTQIILDTGADASMVPESLRELGAAVPSNVCPPRLCDAQGNAIPTHSLRQYEFWLRNAKGNAYCIREVCVVGRVKVPLLAVGKLFRKGWSLVHKDAGLSLEEPYGLHHTSVKFKNNSLAVAGEIRAITEVPRTLPPRVPKVTLTDEMQGLVGKEGMHVLADGTKLHYTARASHLLDARPWYDPNFFKARTTLFQSNSGQWLQVENSADYVNEPNPFTLASSHPKPRITMISSSPFSVDFFPEGGVPPKPSEELLRLYPQPMEDVAAPSTPEDVAPPMTPWDENAQNTRGREPTEHRGREPAEHQGREPAEHQGREPAEHQGREPAEHQGPEPEGDDPAMLPQGLEQEELEAYAANNAAEQLQGLDRRDPVPRSQPEGPPSAEEVAAHNLTHVPFQRWCESCVATRSRADAHHTGANRETKVPVVQIDFYFTSLDDHARPAGQGEQDTCCLIGVDLETKMVLSVPRRSPASLFPSMATRL